MGVEGRTVDIGPFRMRQYRVYGRALPRQSSNVVGNADEFRYRFAMIELLFSTLRNGISASRQRGQDGYASCYDV